MAEQKEMVVQDMAKSKSENNLILKEIHTNDLSLRLCGNDRLIDCIGKDWLPISRTEKPDDYGQLFLLKAFIDKINGKWSILRHTQEYLTI